MEKESKRSEETIVPDKPQDKPQKKRHNHPITENPLQTEKKATEKVNNLIPDKEICKEPSQYHQDSHSVPNLYTNPMIPSSSQLGCALYNLNNLKRITEPYNNPQTVVKLRRPIFSHCAMHVAITHFIDLSVKQKAPAVICSLKH